jgi:Right handed beta helix region
MVARTYRRIEFAAAAMILLGIATVVAGPSSQNRDDNARAAGSLNAAAGDVRRFGALGDGVIDDTSALLRAIAANPDGAIEFSRGSYKITRTIEIPLNESGRLSLIGKGVGRVLMSGPGPAFRFVGTHTGTADPASVKHDIWLKQRMPLLDGLEIAGDHPEADGVEFVRCHMPTLAHVLIRDVRHGVRLVERNRNLIVDGCHIYNCRGVGVFLDHVNLHQALIHGSHISYCKGGGIKVLDGEIRNLEITGNDIEYNHDTQASASADVWIDVTHGSVREGTIVGNTIQALYSPGGANIRFAGPEDVNKVSMFTITGNYLSNQEVNIHLKNCRGIVLSGNSVALSHRRNLLIEGSRHIVVGSHSIDHNPDYKQPVVDGITLRDCDGCQLNGILIEGANAGSEQDGGAIEIYNCRDILVANCQVFEPKFRGIYMADCRDAIISGCVIRDRQKEKSMLAGLHVVATNRATLQNNVIDAGSLGREIVDERQPGP